jgi:hypothetical protein
MMELIKVWCSTTLNKSKTYQIDGTLYRYLYKDGTTQHPQYIFRPLSGQRKQADLRLNHQKLLSRCYEVPGLSQRSEVVSSNAIQLVLF